MLLVDSELGVSKELRDEIEQFFGEYGQAFFSLDAQAVVSFFALPFYVELDGDSFVWGGTEREGLLLATEGMLDYYRGINVRKVEPKVDVILRTGKNRITVVMSWLLVSGEGSRWVLDKSYNLIREGDCWKIWACCGTETHSS